MVSVCGPVAKPLAQRQPSGPRGAFALHASELTNKAVAQVTAEQVLGRPVEAAGEDPVSVVAPKPIARE